MSAQEYGKAEFASVLAAEYDAATLESVVPTVNRWLRRGDGAAVYRNADLGHPQLGAVKIVSFGSKDAQLEIEQADDLPARLPDGLPAGAVNWRYQLDGTYRGETL